MIRPHGLTGALLVLLAAKFACTCTAQTKVAIAEDQPPPVRHAVNALRKALSARNDDLPAEFTVAINKEGVTRTPESLLIHKVAGSSSPGWIASGSDEIGLAYALREIARSIDCTPKNEDWRARIRETAESPYLKTRSITIQLFNAALEREWYFSEDFWHSYFGMLADHRFNQFTLTFGHQTNYLNPVYPWLFELPDYPEVRVRGLTDEDRARNLEMLARIAEMAGEYGLKFVLGIWTQQPVEKYGRRYLDGFPSGAAARDYCAKGLTKLLIACPGVDGVQFRMNIEAGIPEDVQNDYFQAQFDAIRQCGRDVKLDLRYKGLRQETIRQAVATGLDLTVSTKFWCEHMGLPFHPTTQDRLYRESRYGYGAMLAKPRDYRVVYRMWTAGSQRLLLWGDPDYARRFAGVAS